MNGLLIRRIKRPVSSCFPPPPHTQKSKGGPAIPWTTPLAFAHVYYTFNLPRLVCILHYIIYSTRYTFLPRPGVHVRGVGVGVRGQRGEFIEDLLGVPCVYVMRGWIDREGYMFIYVRMQNVFTSIHVYTCNVFWRREAYRSG